jgi:hypothetical protein
MNIAFYLDEMNFRGVSNSTYQFAFNNEKILKNKSIIFYNKKNYRNQNEVIVKFKKSFRVYGVTQFKEINKYKKKFNIKFIYTQKSGNKDSWFSSEIKTIVHSVYPQKLNQTHGYNYAYISEWLSKNFSNKKIPFVPYITENSIIKENLKKKLKINNKKIVLGCHGGSSSFDIKFAQDSILATVKKRNDIIFLFLNIDKFCNHRQIKFIKGTSDEHFKKKFINTCDAMIYGRSLGESFGLACAEFAIQNKEIISYKFNRHRSHKHSIQSKNFHEYSSYKTLCNLLMNYNKKSSSVNYKSKYKKYRKKNVMKIFEKVFLTKKNEIFFNIMDHVINIISHLKMHYLYCRHKIYTFYFNYVESKFFI